MTRFSVVLVVLALGSGCLTEPTHSHQSDVGRSFELQPGDRATYDVAPFRQVGLLIDTQATRIEARVDGAAWRPVEVTWAEGAHKVARLVLDGEGQELELRANAPWTFGTIQFYDDVVASDELARDLPVAEPVVSPNGIAPADLVVSRAQWGARDPNKVCGSAHNPYRMAIHHTASPTDDGGDAAARMRQIQAYHIDSNGWCDIGYHFVVSQGGQVFQGRSDEQRTGAHVGNDNSGNVGICFIGNFETQTVSDTQLNAGAEIVGWVGRTYDIPFNRQSIKGHREHAGQSTACPGADLLGKLDQLISRAQNPVPTEPVDVAFEVNWLDAPTDLYVAGSSAQKPDFFEGETLRAEIRFTNTTTAPLRNVQLGYWLESPHLEATSYVIESDAPAFDGQTFSVNDANENPDNPAAGALGVDGALGLYAMAAGETKRIVVDLVAQDYSIGLADHPDLRGWVRHIDDYYGEQTDFNVDPATNAFDGLLQGYAELDVLSTKEWQFDAGEAEQHEGWSGCAGITPVVDVEAGALTAEFGAGDCVEAPAWTAIDAEAWDQMVVRLNVNADQTAALYWAAEGENFSEERAVAFKVSASNSTYVLDFKGTPSWSGKVARLRLVPAIDGSATAGLDALFVQSSSGDVGSAREAYVPDAPVDFVGDVPAPGVGGPGGNGDGGSSGDPVQENPEDTSEYRVKKGCSTTGGQSSNALWLLGFVAFVRRGRKRRKKSVNRS